MFFVKRTQDLLKLSFLAWNVFERYSKIYSVLSSGFIDQIQNIVIFTDFFGMICKGA